MVSYPDEHRYRSSTSNRTPSVASSSRSSTLRGVRQSRYSKSHAGVFSPASSVSSASTNEYPVYSRSGDVEIILKSGRKEARYILHKLYLAQSSAWFEEVLGLGDGATVHSGMSSSSSVSVGQRVRFELDTSKRDGIPMLVLKVRNSYLILLFMLI
jgi:hypothetical protein